MQKICLAAATLVVLLMLAAPASGHDDDGGSGTVAGGMFDPRGIDVGPGGRLFVAESGSGLIDTIRLRRHRPAKVSTFASLPADPEQGLGPVDVAVSGNGDAYVLMSGPPETSDSAFGQLIQVRPNGKTKLIADIANYQKTDPDPDDQDDFPEESNPNGLALLSGGKILVTDAANNDLLLVDRHGHITTVARFKREEVPWPSGLPFGPPPGTPTPAESVPTAVAVGPDGAWYVSELKGFPFVKGTSRIWRIEPGSKGVTCDPARPWARKCRTVGTDFTSVIDLAFGKHGKMYVLEIVKEGLLAAEFFGEPPIGALWAVKHGHKRELAPGSLLAPGGVAVGHDDSLFVTTGTVFGPGAGAVVRVGSSHGDDD